MLDTRAVVKFLFIVINYAERSQLFKQNHWDNQKKKVYLQNDIFTV